MSWPSVVLAVAAAVVLAAWWRRARRRRREEEATLRSRFEALAGRLGVGLEPTEGGWRVAAPGAPRFSLGVRPVLAAARRAERAGEEEPEERWRAQIAWRGAPLEALTGPFRLKTHGLRVLPRLCHPEIEHLLTREPRPVWRPSALAPLGTLFVLTGDGAPDRLVTEEALREAGVDGRDLEGIALAVLRQRFEEEAPARALAGELVELAPADGCGASRALVAADFLPPGTSLLAAVPAPDVLLLAPSTGRELLRAELERRPVAGEPLSPRLLVLTAEGARWADEA